MFIVPIVKLREEAMMSERIRLDPSIEPAFEESGARSMATISHWFQYMALTYPLFLQTDDYDRELHRGPVEDYFRAYESL